MEYLLSKVSKTSKKKITKLIKLKKLKKFNKPVYLIILGVLLFSFGLYHYLSIRVLSFNSIPEIAESVETGNYPVQIEIPSIDINVEIEPGSIKDGVWDISYDKATFLSSSQRPGSSGNTVIYGHNKKLLFGNLPYLSIGQKIMVKTSDGVIHIYEVYKKDFVSPDRVELVSPTDYEELTLFTCWGLFDSQRVVVKAKPIK